MKQADITASGEEIYLIISFTSQVTVPVASRAAEVMGTNSMPLHGCLDPA